MIYLYFFTLSLLLGLTCTAPTENSDVIVVNDKYYLEKYVIYTGEYDIDNILLPIMSLNEGDDPYKLAFIPVIFFTLADYTNGKREDKGFYICKNEKVTKLLDHGRDAATASDGKNTIYIAAEDGLYTYNFTSDKAVKYGTVTDDIIGIAKVNGSDIIYILTKDHTVYKVTEQGMKKDKVSVIDNAEQIVLDFQNNLYYVANNNVHVFGVNGTKVIEGLLEPMTYVRLIRPPITLSEGIPVAINNNIYVAFANGTSTRTIFNITSRPTAYSVDAGAAVYLGHNKKIYHYNMAAILLESIMSGDKENVSNVYANVRKFMQQLKLH